MTVNRRMLWMACIAVFVASAGFLPAVFGAAPATGAVEAGASAEPGLAVREGMSWQEIVQHGGSLMWVLAGLSVLTLAFVIYFFVILRKSMVAPRALQRELVDKLRSGAMDDARRLCEFRSCPLSSVAMSAMDYARDVPQADAMLLKDVIEGEGSRQAEHIQGQTQYLMDIAAVAPLIGLLGTVFGMLRAFSSVALNIANAKPVVLAAGVSQALVTTAFGLMIGIPAMAFYAYFRRKAAKLVAFLEASSTEVLTALLSERSL